MYVLDNNLTDKRNIQPHYKQISDKTIKVEIVRQQSQTTMG